MAIWEFVSRRARRPGATIIAALGINARFLVKSESSKARPTLLTTTIVDGSAYCTVSMGLGLRPTELPLRPIELPPPPLPPPPTIHRLGADPWQLMCPGTAISRS